MIAPELLKRRFSRGIMAFPATPFLADGALDLAGYERHVSFLAAHAPTALVAAGGAGEIFSLTLAEHEALIRTTVQCAGGLPVVGGVAYGTAMASQMAQAVERAGGDAVLLLPPYLVRAEQEGLLRHIRAVCESVSIAVIPYSRDNAVISPDTLLKLAELCPNLIALKDGTGNLSNIERLTRRAGERIAIINGAPTAEVFATRYWELGVHSYSSAVFTFLPTLARRFFTALNGGETPAVEQMLNGFYTPLVRLRDRKHGYAVSIVKAGLRVMGRSAGPVRPPLIDLDAEEERRLAALIESAAEWNR